MAYFWVIFQDSIVILDCNISLDAALWKVSPNHVHWDEMNYNVKNFGSSLFLMQIRASGICSEVYSEG